MPAVKVLIKHDKGGVAKTTLTAVLGVGFAAYGYRAVIVDLDTQGSQAVQFSLYGTQGRVNEVVHRVLTNELRASNALTRIADDTVPRIAGREQGTLHVMLGGPLIEKSIREIQADPKQFGIVYTPNIVRDALEDLSSVADVIFMDLGPSQQLLDTAAMIAADYVLIPTLCDVLSVTQIKNVVDRINFFQRKANPNLQLLGVVPVMTHHYQGMILERKAENFKQGWALLQELYGDVLLTDIPDRNSWRDIVWTSEGHTILTAVDADKKAVAEAWRFVDEVAVRMGVDIYEHEA